MALAIRNDAPELRKAFNGYLTTKKLTESAEYKGDLQEIKKQKELRILTYESFPTFYQIEGQLLGFDYELTRKFAKEELGVQLKMVVVPPKEDIFTWLKDGKGDMIATGSALQPQIADLIKTTPYYQTNGILIGRQGKTEEDIADKTIWMAKHSPYSEWAKSFTERYKNVTIKIATELPPHLLIEKVSQEDIDFAIVDSHHLQISSFYFMNVKSMITGTSQKPVNWITRKDNRELLAKLNQYINKKRGSLFFNLTYDVYFNNTQHSVNHVHQWFVSSKQISPYDQQVQNFSEQYHLDWRLITAQIYQESQFDPQAKSKAGARGLMQLLPHTAKQMGFKHLMNPEISIEAGIKYLDWVRQRFSNSLPIEEQIWFALAAYNAGIGHVKDAQILAKELNLNPNKWFGHVEEAISLLARPQYYKKAKYGRCNGKEPVKYVKQIRNRYLAYMQLTKT